MVDKGPRIMVAWRGWITGKGAGIMRKVEKAFGYLRVSGKGQEEGDGFDRQKMAIEKFAKRGGYKIVEFFSDVHTGTIDAVNRPAFSQMVRDMNGTKTIVVERLDRLARSVVVAENTVVWLASHGIDLISADTEENITESYKADPMKKAMIQMGNVFAELEKSVLVRKLRAARQRTRKKQGHISKAGHLLPTGKCEGIKAYGEIDPQEQETIKRIIELRKTRLTLRVIAKTLDKEGHRTRLGGKWSGQVVKNILGPKLSKRQKRKKAITAAAKSRRK